MKQRSKIRLKIMAILAAGNLVTLSPCGWAETPAEETAPAETTQVAQVVPMPVPSSEVLAPQLISLDFKDADLQNVLRALAQKGNVNIVTSPGIGGNVTIRLDNVPWETALDVILKSVDLTYERNENVITVMTTEEMLKKHELERELTAQEPLISKVMILKYLDAADVQLFLQPQLSPQGRISILEITGQRGWTFGIGAGKKQVKAKARTDRDVSRAKALLITDTPSSMRRLEAILDRVDVKPTQILIEARVMEVNRDLVRDLGFDFATGSSGLTNATTTITQTPMAKQNGTTIAQFGLQTLTGQVTPNIFNPKTTTITTSNTGIKFQFQKLTGFQFDVLVRALEEDARANTLSAPQILTLSGQEASIIVGTKYPILKTQVSGETTTTTTTTLDYYQDIGVQLYVVPQVSGDKYIDMIIHPTVSTFTSTVGTNAYPVIIAREAETQMVIEDGDTVVLGGLLKDVKANSRIGLPFLSKIPILGLAFSRATTDVEKIDLLIFITARIVRFDQFTPEELAELKAKYETAIPIQGTLRSEGKAAVKSKSSSDKAKKKGKSKR